MHGGWPDNLTVVNAPLLKNRLSSGERIVKVAKDGKRLKQSLRSLSVSKVQP